MRRKLVTAAKEEEEKPSFSQEEKKTRNEAPFLLEKDGSEMAPMGC